MAEIGYRLIRAREARGLTLEDAERDTRISRRYLEALESEQFEVIPAPVYARGFLRSYSQYLGMDPGEMLALFPREGDAPGSSNGVVTKPSLDTPVPATSASRPNWRRPPRFDGGPQSARNGEQSRPRRREAPPPVRGGGATLAPPRPRPQGAEPAPEDGEYVIGAPPAQAPAETRRRPAVRPGHEVAAVESEPMIGQPVAGAARRLTPGGSGNNRAMVVIGIAVAAIAFVVLVAFLVASLGGDSGGTGATRTATPAAGSSGAASGSATTAAAGATSSAPRQGVVPPVIDLTEERARSAIKDAGFQVEVIKEKSARTKGTVTSQAPDKGTALAPGSTVTISVSDGP